MAEVIDPETAVLHIPKMIRQDEYGYRTSVEAKDVAPLSHMPLNEPFHISRPGTAASSFVLKRFAEGYYICSCPAWKFSTERDKMRKTCQHLMDVLGETYETERISLAQEAKSTIWEINKFRRTTSQGHHTRHMHAKGVLDDHFRQLSQSQPEPSTSNLEKAKDPSASEKAGSEAGPSKTSQRRAKPANDSETETETEDEILHETQPTRAASPSPAVPKPATAAASLSRSRPDDQDEDEDRDAFDPDSVHASPSKRARRGRASACDDSDDKISLLLAKPWLLEADPSKPRSKAMDPTNWWVSEKLDGVRAFWDGQRLYSRQKIEWNAPTWWKERLPKDITLDGELWMARGMFSQTSQICRTTVRLGRLRTFTHFLQRDSMERQWLREQLGGRLASQHRLLAAKSAATCKALGRADTGASGSAVPSASAWKTLKASVFKASARTSKRALRRELQRSPTERAVLPRSLLLALFGRSLDPSSESKSANGPRLARRRPVIVKRCPWCGKILQRRRTQPSSAGEPASSDPPRRDSAVRVRRTNADQLPFVLPLMSTSTFNPPLDAGPVNTTPSSSRRPHPYALLGSLRSINTHVCRRKSKSSSEWNRIKFMIFDSPSMGSRPVEERWAELEKRFGSTDGLDIDAIHGSSIKLVQHVKCEGRDHLIELMETVESKGGEGLMLRQPGSKYEGRRGNTLFKLKSWYDAEAEVIGYANGTGRHEGRTGSLVARMECGTVFRVGTGLSDAQRDNPPPIGSIINYRFFELSEDGYPRFPAFRGIAWDKTRPKDAVLRPRAGVPEDRDE
ncbi:hypothetical protein PaG_02782 [Moesziomyces aphidis]|uniref:DNA ligase n=1 Tax=Moesziomyces aphidis TaxID=84754 RepID=W3VNB0_MOEAP|nr:hypothetical protein PaG_02782 [Moesziomyces aphidis]